MIDKITAHADAAKARLLQQYKASPNLMALMDALFGSQVQEIEDVLHDLYTRLDIDSCDGRQLDNIGTIVALERMGFDDSLYRILLKAEIGKDVSNGTMEEVINVWKLISQAGRVQVVETYPAQIELYSDTPIAGEIAAFTGALMQKTVGAGVKVDFLAIVFSTTNAFGFDPDDADVNGFGDLNDASAGGELAYIQMAE